MEENKIISGKQQLSVVPIIIAVIGVLILIAAWSGLFGGRTYFSNGVETGFTPPAWAIFLGFAVLILGVVTTIGTSCCSIFVTDKRVYGKAVFGKRVDIPIDSVSAVGLVPLFSGISISSSSGAIKFLYISNSEQIHAEISKLIIARQDDKHPIPEKIEMAQSSADELKKYKDLFDNGVITEEEYEAKKKQLLGL